MRIVLLLVLITTFLSCKKDPPGTSTAKINFQYLFDENQERLNNIGQPAAIPAGNAAQTPDFKLLSVHYIELVPTQWTPYGDGFVVYKGPEVMTGGEKAIDFDQNIVAEENIIFKTFDIRDIPPGTYTYIRASVAYQNYDVLFNIRNIPVLGDLIQQRGSVASFLGYNTFINNVTPNAMTMSVNGAKKQGFWVFETDLTPPYDAYNQLYSGEAPEGATTVVNPLAGISDIPAGSCVITGRFDEPLVITGDEAQDITVTLSFSTNQSFEWIDYDGNGALDLDVSNPEASDKIVDMGLRGLLPYWQ